jgi:hypothetical protein
VGESVPNRSPFLSFRRAQAFLASSAERLESNCTCTPERFAGFSVCTRLATVAGKAGA